MVEATAVGITQEDFKLRKRWLIFTVIDRIFFPLFLLAIAFFGSSHQVTNENLVDLAKGWGVTN